MCSPSLIPTCSATIDGSPLETQASAQEDGVLSQTILVPVCILCASLAMTQFRHIIIDSTATSLQDFSYCRGSLLETHLVGSGHSTLLSRLHEIQGITLPSYKTYPTCSLKVDHRKNSLQHWSHMIVSPTGYSPQKMSYGLLSQLETEQYKRYNTNHTKGIVTSKEGRIRTLPSNSPTDPRAPSSIVSLECSVK